MDSTIKSIKIEGTCRTCMNETVNLSSIYDYPTRNDYVHNPLRFVDLLAITIPQLTAVQAAEELPKGICIECISKLLSCYEFQEMCLQSESRLRQLLQGTAKGEHSHQYADIPTEDMDPLQSIDNVRKNYILPKIEKDAAFLHFSNGEDSPQNQILLEDAASGADPFGGSKAKRKMQFQCGKCDKQFYRTYNVKRHLKVHNVAPECMDEFIVTLNLDSADNHVSRSSNNDESGKRKLFFKCGLCSQQFYRTCDVKRHLRVHNVAPEHLETYVVPLHPGPETFGSSNNEDELEDTVEMEVFRCECAQCGRRFSRIYSLKRHLQSRHSVHVENLSGFIIKLNEDASDENKILRHTPREVAGQTKQYSEKPVNCEEDEKSKKKLMKFKCNLCSKRFYRTYNLKRHFKALHTRILTNGELQVIVNSALRRRRRDPNRPKVQCEYCEKTFFSVLNLRKHLMTHDQSVASRRLCPICGKGVSGSSSMSEHLKRHSNKREFECPECPRKFPLRGDLAKHSKVHVKIKPYVCDICEKGFVRSYSLRFHKLTHSGEKPHKCDHCEMRFAKNQKKIQHMRTHTGEKPYQCKYCERAFAQKGDLNKHLRLHLGPNIYRCELCPQSFPKHAEMMEHFALHKHDDEETRERNLKAKMESVQKDMELYTRKPVLDL